MEQYVVMAGVGATLVWFLISLLLKKDSIQKSFTSAAIFAVSYVLAGFAYNFINKIISRICL